jgi:nucleotide-binding universal stress UspA family protein
MSAPFRRVLVPYDGSEPSERALAFALALARAGSALDIVYVVDRESAIVQSTTTLEVYDPTPIFEALEQRGHALLDAVRERCRSSGVDASTSLIHQRPVPGILATAEKNGDQLIILGTHARAGLPRTFLGSTTEGVLRSGKLPVLAISAAMTPPHEVLFRKVLVAIDESDPAGAAVALAAGLSRALGTLCVLCGVVDTRDLYGKAGTYGYDPAPLAAEMGAHAEDVVERARAHGGFAADSVSVAIVEAEPARGIIEEASRSGADAIVMGSHGRRGLQRLFLGSVAEHVLRNSPIPVLVVRS